MERYNAHDARIIPILVRHCEWRTSPIKALQILPRDVKPISAYRDKDIVWAQIAQALPKVIKEFPDTSLINNIPYRYNHNFIGRETLLVELASALETNKDNPIQAISGLGGVGKTQIAIEYVRRYEKQYEKILWSNADTPEALNEGYREIARLLELSKGNEQDQKLIVNAVKRWLEEEKKTAWLLVLDNVETWEKIDTFIPYRFVGHILLTTQAKSMGGIQIHTVEGLGQDEGALLLLGRAKLITPHHPLEVASHPDFIPAREISQKLGGLPLALDQAGAYIDETKCSLPHYLYLYQKEKRALLEARGASRDGHNDLVAATFNLSFDKVKKDNPYAIDLLHLCAFLAHDVIPETIITKGAPHLGWLASIDEVALAFDKAIRTLRGYSLIECEASNEMERSLRIHNLVQIVIKGQLDALDESNWAERTVRAVSAALPSVEPVEAVDWLRWEHIVPHAQVCAQYIEDHKMQFKEATDLLSNTGLYLTERAQYDDAEKLLLQSLTILKPYQPPDPLALVKASVLRSLANIYSEVGEYEEAENHYQQSQDIFEKSEPNRASILGLARLLNNRAIIFKVDNRFYYAEDSYKRCLDIWSQYPDELLNYAQSLNNLAVLYAEQYCYYEKATSLFQSSLSIQEQESATDTDAYARCLSNLANLYTQQLGRLSHEDREQQMAEDSDLYTHIEDLYQKSLHILETNKGPEHPDVAYPLNGLAILYYKQGRYTAAEPLYQRSQLIWEQSLRSTPPHKHPQAAYSFNNQAILYFAQEKYDEAQSLCKKAHEIFKDRLGDAHPHIRLCDENCRKIEKAIASDSKMLK